MEGAERSSRSLPSLRLLPRRLKRKQFRQVSWLPDRPALRWSSQRVNPSQRTDPARQWPRRGPSRALTRLEEVASSRHGGREEGRSPVTVAGPAPESESSREDHSSKVASSPASLFRSPRAYRAREDT